MHVYVCVTYIHTYICTYKMSEQCLEHEYIKSSIYSGLPHQLPLSLEPFPPCRIASVPPRLRQGGQKSPAPLTVGKIVVGSGTQELGPHLGFVPIHHLSLLTAPA